MQKMIRRLYERLIEIKKDMHLCFIDYTKGLEDDENDRQNTILMAMT